MPMSMRFRPVILAATVSCAPLFGIRCTPIAEPPDESGPVYYNTTDPTNKGATYLGSEACRACHRNIDQQQIVHGHAQVLKSIQGEPPAYPEAVARAGVPEPPADYQWADIAYVIGGYIRKARFIDQDGYVLTTGLTGVPTQWNLALPANGTEPGFVDYEPTATQPKPYDFSCFTCHTTGAKAQDSDFPENQENRPGFIGTWEEAGVQCEECHGPGSNHIPNPPARDIFVDVAASHCGRCHTRGDDPNVIIAADGFIQNRQQWPELLASGGHAEFDCITCHDPHVSANHERANAIRNECTDCHAQQNMAAHNSKTFVRSDYVEQLRCESCHMPFATKSASSAPAAIVGDTGRLGDERTHIFRIDEDGGDYTSMFTEDGSRVVKDSQGRVAVTVDFVCLRCHNGIGSAFELTVSAASAIASEMHENLGNAEGKAAKAASLTTDPHRPTPE